MPNNTLTFGIQLQGGTQASAQLQQILNLQKQIIAQGNSASSVGKFFAALSPQQFMRQPGLFSQLVTAAQGVPPIIPQRLMPNFFLAQAQKSAAAMGPLFPQPPGINWRMAAMGAAVSPFSSYFGARTLSQAFGGFFGGAGGGNGIAKGLFGPGGLPVFDAFFIAIRAMKLAIEGVIAAMHLLARAVNEGAKLFESAAKIGRTPSKTALLEGAAGALGIGTDGLEQLIIKGEYPNRGGRSLRINDENLSAWRGVMPTGQLQQLQNLKDYWNLFTENMAQAAQVMGENAKSAFDVKFAWEQFAFTFKAAASEIVKDVGPSLILLLRIFTEELKNMMNAMRVIANLVGLDAFNKFLTKINVGIGTIAGNLPEFKGGNIGLHQMPNVNAFQRMGFVMNGQESDRAMDYARQTALNTEDMVKLMASLNTNLLKKIPTDVMNMP